MNHAPLDKLRASRRLEILATMALRSERPKNHVLVVQRPDGTIERRSALMGGICCRCAKPISEILDCKGGERCDPRNAAWAKGDDA